MKRITIIQNQRSLNSFLSRLDKKDQRVRKFLVWKQLDKKTLAKLKSNRIEPVNLYDVHETHRMYFIQEYRELIGRISRNNHHRVWWASDLSSKNQMSLAQLPAILEQFVQAMQAVKNENVHQLLILFPIENIEISLKKAFRGQDYQWEYLGKRWMGECLLVYQFLRKLISYIYQAIKMCQRSKLAKKNLGSLLQQAVEQRKKYYAVKTFVYNHSFQPVQGKAEFQYRDNFFGNLPEYLGQKKELIFLANIIGDYRPCLESILKCPSSQRIFPFEIFLSVKEILLGLAELIFTPIKTGEEKFYGEDAGDIIRRVIFRYCKAVQFPFLMHYRATRNFLSLFDTETFLMTYENYPWERMCLSAIQDGGKNISTIGYQHTVVPQSYLNYFLSEAEKSIIPLPKKILTTGFHPQDIMARYGYYQGVHVEPGCALRFQYLFDLKVSPRKRISEVMVAIEGSYLAVDVIQYVLNELGGNARYKLRIRTHPLLPFKKIKKILGWNWKKFSNISVSERNSLKQDIEETDAVLYWGTTVAMEVLMSGKPAIHYNRGNILSFDPLFECPHLKWGTTPFTSLESVLDEINSLSDARYEEKRAKAKEYLKEYFHKNEEANLAKFLS